ncbi:hypothetical protein CON33_21090 [Bacillus anthracis]|nr:hypothetical protein CON33_21090 [Bacillus anthracis]PGP15582.1 hypothetical protein CN994_25205 [Bacillus anthracis]
MNKDDKFVRALIKGTEKKKANWNTVANNFYKDFREVGEFIEDAYSYLDATKSRRIIIYKASITTTDHFGEDLEKVNMHLVIAKGTSYEGAFKISDYDLNDSSLLWTLYKMVQRSESGADSLIDDLIKEFDDDDDLPF